MPRLDDVAFCRMRPILDRRSVSMRGVRKTEREREGGREGEREREELACLGRSPQNARRAVQIHDYIELKV